jgi:DNA repair protein RecO (recombination protein O)
MRVDLHPCYVLHTRPYRETSLLVDILSSNYGRLCLVAKGVKRAKNNKANLLQIAKRISLAWSQRGTLGNLIEVEDLGDRFNLNGSKIISCFYMNELLMRMLHTNEPHPEVFDIYQQTLTNLTQNQDEHRTLRIFEKKILQVLGYGLILDHDANTGEQIDVKNKYYYVAEFGPCISKNNGLQSIQISGKALKALDDENIWNNDIAKEAKQLLRMLLKIHVGDKPFGSRELYRAYLQNLAAI